MSWQKPNRNWAYLFVARVRKISDKCDKSTAGLNVGVVEKVCPKLYMYVIQSLCVCPSPVPGPEAVL